MNNLNQDHCPVAKTVRLIGSKWSLLIIHNLCSGTKRFGELQSFLGVNPKTLSSRLSELEKDGLIKRRAFKEVPLRVEYSLTPKGETLKEIFDKMAQFGKFQSNGLVESDSI